MLHLHAKTVAASAVLALGACAGRLPHGTAATPRAADDVVKEAICAAERSYEEERLLNVSPGIGGAGTAGTPEEEVSSTGLRDCSVILAQ